MADESHSTFLFSHTSFYVKRKTTFTWTIPGLDLFHVVAGTSLKSDAFINKQTESEWDLTFRIHVNKTDHASYVSLALNLLKSNTEKVIADFSVNISTTTGRLVYEFSNRQNFKKEPTYEEKTFMKRTEFMNRLVNNTVVITVTVEECLESNQDTQSEVATQTPDVLVTPRPFVSENKKFLDLKISVSGQEIYSHCAVLSSASLVFSGMIEETDPDSRIKMITIEKFDYITIQQLIQFIHTRVSPDFQCLGVDHCLHILEAASYFVVADLKELCIGYLSEVIQMDNVGKALLVAHGNRLEGLRKICFRYLLENRDKLSNDLSVFGDLEGKSGIWRELILAFANSTAQK